MESDENDEIPEHLVSLNSLISRVIDIYTVVVFPIVLAVFGIYRETWMLVAIAAACIEVVFVVYKIKEREIFEKFEFVVDRMKTSKKLYDKQDEFLRLSTEATALKNFLDMVNDLDKAITKNLQAQKQPSNNEEFARFVNKDVLEVIYARSNVFGISDNYTEKFKISVYKYSSSKNRLVPSFQISKNVPSHRREWAPWQGCTGRAWSLKKAVRVEDITKDPTIRNSVEDRPTEWDELYRSLISHPIMLNGERQPIGVITLSCNRINQFARLHERELSVISNQWYRLLEFAETNKIDLSFLSTRPRDVGNQTA